VGLGQFRRYPAGILKYLSIPELEEAAQALFPVFQASGSSLAFAYTQFLIVLSSAKCQTDPAALRTNSFNGSSIKLATMGQNLMKELGS
jgi:hypothetical protein